MHAPTTQLVLLFVTALASFGTAQESEDCPYADITPEHTFCKLPNPECKILASGVTPEDAEIIVKAHNDYRSKIAKGEETTGGLEPAANMLQLVWDDDLAAVAQKHADQCKIQHDCGDCRRINKDESVGQNLFMSTEPGGDNQDKSEWETAVRAWYGEVDKFNKNSVKEFAFASESGHFSQVIWATTGRVGCGFTVFEASPGTISKLYVCNYSPSGNVIGGQIYEEGDSCSKCPEGCTCGEGEYADLCAMSG